MEIFCDCEPQSKYYMPKLLTLDKEDNVMSYGYVYLHRSYIVMDPPTCGVCLGSFASQKIVPSRDTTCASKKTLKPKSLP